MSDLQVERVGDLSGGRNSAESDFLVQSNQSPDDLNLTARPLGTVRRRDGSDRVFGAAVSTRQVLGAATFYKSDGSKYVVFGAGDSLFAHDLASKQTSRIDSGYVQCQPWSFATFRDSIYCTNFADTPVRWDGSTLTAVGLVRPSFTGTPSITPGAGYLSATTYYYRLVADYGGKGQSNASDEVITVVTNVFDQVTIPSQAANLPAGARGFYLYRTKAGAPANPALRVYYFVEKFTDSYVDRKADGELTVRYPGDRPQPFNAAFLAKHVNRLWYGNLMERTADAAYNSRIAYSALYQPDILGDDVLDPGYIEIYPEDGDVVTGIRPLNGVLVVFKRHHIYTVYGNSVLDFDVRDTHSDVGCVAPRSIAEVNNKLYFLSDKGVYLFDGQGTLRVSDRIRPDLEALSPTAMLWATGGSFRNRYYLSVAA